MLKDDKDRLPGYPALVLKSMVSEADNGMGIICPVL
jgi:hypothetical protein